MDEQEKPFDVVWIVLLVLIALVNDAAEIFFDLLAATGVGLPGEAIMEPINLVMDGLFTFVFFMKCGFGGPSIMQLVDDVLEILGVPGRTICVVIGIYIANHPKLAKVAEVAGGAGEGAAAGELGAVEEAGAAAEEGEQATAVASEAGEATQGGEQLAIEAQESAEAGAETQISKDTPKEVREKAAQQEAEGGSSETEASPEETEEEKDKESKSKELEQEMETEEEKSPEEVAQEKLFEEVAAPSTDDDEEEPESNNNNLVSGEAFRERQKQLQKVQDVKKNLVEIKKPGEIEAIDDQDNNLKKAA